MAIEESGYLLRIFIGENERHHGKAVYELVVEKAREMGLAGATVFRGIAGFGTDKRLHTARILQLSEDLPVVIEIMDSRENIDRLFSYLEEVLSEGVATLEPVTIFRFKA